MCGTTDRLRPTAPQWRAPGAAPVIDSCGSAGGRLPGQGKQSPFIRTHMALDPSSSSNRGVAALTTDGLGHKERDRPGQTTSTHRMRSWPTWVRRSVSPIGPPHGGGTSWGGHLMGGNLMGGNLRSHSNRKVLTPSGSREAPAAEDPNGCLGGGERGRGRVDGQGIPWRRIRAHNSCRPSPPPLAPHPLTASAHRIRGCVRPAGGLAPRSC